MSWRWLAILQGTREILVVLGFQGIGYGYYGMLDCPAVGIACFNTSKFL